jgi:predicted tellurium resistance membrane protein TerC
MNTVIARLLKQEMRTKKYDGLMRVLIQRIILMLIGIWLMDIVKQKMRLGE